MAVTLDHPLILVMITRLHRLITDLVEPGGWSEEPVSLKFWLEACSTATTFTRPVDLLLHLADGDLALGSALGLAP